jgi:hypothetical protein
MGSRDTVTGHFPSFVCQAGTIQDLTRDTVPDGVVRGGNKPLTANTEPKIGSQAHRPPRKARVADIRRELEPEWGDSAKSGASATWGDSAKWGASAKAAAWD